MKSLVICLQFLCLVATGQNPDINQFFPIDPAHSYIEFSIKYMGYAKVKGRFTDFSGLIRADDKNLSNTSVSLLIKTASIDTDLDFRDKDLQSDDWFDAIDFPTIVFVSKKFEKTATGYSMIGDLTLKGVTKEIILKMEPPSGIVKDMRADAQVVYSGTTTLDRTQYGIEGKRWSAVKEGVAGVGNEVQIDFSMLGKQLKIANFANWVKNEERPAGKIYKLIKEQGLKQGLAEFKTLVDHKTAHKDILEIVGYMLRLEGQLPEATAVYEANKEAFPEFGEMYYSLGEVYLMSGNVPKAKEYFAEAYKKDPTDVAASEILRHLR